MRVGIDEDDLKYDLRKLPKVDLAARLYKRKLTTEEKKLHTNEVNNKATAK
jgi:hypothetical protein